MLGKSEQNPNEPLFTFEEVSAQEEQFVLDHFTQKDVRGMAEIMFEICDEYQMSFAFSIYLNGVTVFQYLPEGTGKCHAEWMRKKINTVMTMGMSTMRLWALGDMLGKKRVPSFLPADDIVECGGGFPIKVNSAGLIGAIACSGPGDQNDHEFCLEVMKRYTEKTAQ